VLTGGSGDDTLNGGVGMDVFVFSSGGGTDTVIGFENNRDTLDFSAFDFADVNTTLGYAVQIGAHVRFDMPSGEVVWVNNVTEAILVDDILV
jgi:Ca2+-binding RTX toxin-like protein